MFNNFTDTAAMVRGMERMADVSGCTIEWLPDGDEQPRTCMKSKKVYLPKPQFTWDKHAITMWRGMARHEVGHHHPSQAAITELMEREDIAYSGKMGLYINAIDDIWQEMVTSAEYEGSAYVLSYLHSSIIKRSVTALSGGSGYDQEMVDLIGFAYHCRSAWQPEVQLVVADFDKYADYSRWEHLAERVNGIVTHDTPAEELYAIVREMLESNGDDPDDEEIKGKPDEGEGEGDQDGDESGDEEGEGKDGEGSGDKSDESDEDGKVKSAYVSYKELMGHTHAEGSGEKTAGNIKIDYDHDPAPYEPYSLEDIHTNWDNFPDKAYYYNPSPGDMDRVWASTKHVTNSIRRLFQSASQSSREYQLKRGKLTAKHLSRAAMGDPRIFNRPIERIDNSADVYILCDASGSMSFRKYDYMVSAVASLTQALDVARVPNNVTAFTELEGKCFHIPIKPWGEKLQWEGIRDRFGDMVLMQNADGDNLMQAYRELMARDSKRKILIVMSDGQPSCDRGGDAYNYLKRVTHMIENKSPIELYGIGMCTEDVKQFYKEYSIVNDPSEIEGALTGIVRKKIIGA